MTRMLWFAAVAAVILFLLTACSDRGERFRYKMTVEVDTPDGVRSGYSVHEVRARYRNHFGLAPRSRTMDTIGEAVAVDLPDGQTLFVLTPSPDRIQSVLDPAWHNDWVESAQRITTEKNLRPVRFSIESKRDRTPDGLPRQFGGLFVRFRDINRPESIEELDPARLEQGLGAGHALRGITIQLTDDPVTSGIERRLAWLPKYYDLKFSGDRYQSIENRHKGLSAYITSGAFSAGMGLSPHDRG